MGTVQNKVSRYQSTSVPVLGTFFKKYIGTLQNILTYTGIVFERHNDT